MCLLWGGIELFAARVQLERPPKTDIPVTSSFGDCLKAIDFDGDGFCDLVIGDSRIEESRGVICVYRGGTIGLAQEPVCVIRGSKPGERLGHGFEMVDVNLDGLPDLVVSRMFPTTSNRVDGFAVYPGVRGGISPTPTIFWIPDGRGLELSHLRFFSADINGDGHPDLVCRGYDKRVGTDGRPCLFGFFSQSNGLANSPQWIIHGETKDDEFGFATADAGDVNHDGYRDLIVGAYQYSGVSHLGGRAYLFLGGKNGTSTNAAWIGNYPLSNRPGVDAPGEQEFGFSVAGVGDINHDGYDDVVIGAPFADHDETDEGVVCLFLGGPTGLAKNPASVLQGNHRYASLGYTVCAVGDVDGDGYNDIAIGAKDASDDQAMEGAVMIVRGNATGLEKEAWWIKMSDQSNLRLGSLVVSGDFNGDHRPDIAAACSPEDKGGHNAILAWTIDADSPSGNFNWPIRKSWWQVVWDRWRFCSVYARCFYTLGAIGLVATPAFFWHRTHRRAQQERIAHAESIQRERERIARNLHDELGTMLNKLAVFGVSGAETGELVQNISATIERAVRTLQPQSRRLADFGCDLSDLVETQLRDLPIERRFQIPLALPNETIPPQVCDAVYHCVQEAVTNVRKHSRASRVTVWLELEINTVRVSIQDNGSGFKPNGHGRGRGVANLRHRMHEIGGRCDWITPKTGGTSVELSFSRQLLEAVGKLI